MPIRDEHREPRVSMAVQDESRRHARRVRVSVVQDAPVVFDREGTLERIEALTADAADAGAELVLFPEAFLPGYPYGLTFGAAVGTRTADGRELYRRYWSSAIDVPGPAIERLSACAAAHHLHVVIGAIERDGGTLYCSVLFFGPDGRLLGKHRKLMPTAAERLVWGQGDGSTLTVLDTEIGKLGAALCWENYMPLLRMSLYAKGIQLYCAPTVDDRDTWLPTMRHIAAEGRCFVLSACQYLQRTDCSDVYSGLDVPDIVIRGGSCIISPLGKVLAGPDFSGECILT